MADLKISINLTLKHEGGFTDDSNDRGGATNMGITQKDMPGVNIKDLTVDQAIEYYQENYVKPLYGQIESQKVANKIFDFGVLFGVGTAVKYLQDILKLVVDGSFGPKTLAEVNATDENTLLIAYRTYFIQHVLNIATADASQRQFVPGWLSRINS
jgi:lysozyme family protein